MKGILEFDFAVHQGKANLSLQQKVVIPLANMFFPKALEYIVQIVINAREVGNPGGIHMAKANLKNGIEGAHEEKRSGQATRQASVTIDARTWSCCSP